MQSQNVRIGIDVERLKYPHTGLYHFCWELGKALMLEKSATDELYFYLPPEQTGIFGELAKYVKQSPLHKLIFPNIQSYQVWHSVHQGSEYFPYQGKVPVVLTVHDLNFLHQTQRSKSYIQKRLNSLQQKIYRSQHLVTISAFVLRELQQHLDVSNITTSVIYNGCNFSDVAAIPPKLIPASPFLFTIGTIASKKNFHVLPALLAGNDNHLVIAGIVQEENYVKIIYESARRWGVLDRVHIIGSISESEKKWYYQHCAAFVFPSLAEGFGMPVLEAMDLGKPVFLSSLTSLPEVGGSLAYYFPSFDPDEMRKVLQEGFTHYVNTNPQDLIHQHARSFSWLEAARQYLAIYHRLAGGSVI
ncbi:MAG: glycosyltransferase family 1 protein [Chitinophagia bacterium]|nr:glycosyltransferase family 1 protein [Chitinophagia bacterium]